MEKEISIIKKSINKIIDISSESIIFAKKYGRRNEFLFKLGKDILVQNEVIFENENYIIFGDNIKVEKSEKIKKILK